MWMDFCCKVRSGSTGSTIIILSMTLPLIGEDMELGNRLLSQHCSRDNRRTDPKLLGDAYAQLGILMHNGMAMNVDLGEMMKRDERDQALHHLGG